ncbi:hypothetical protein J422_05753 [Methanocaldococcus villosus KIN24-T80]|uniref:TIGR02757 family protein n=1 Tax=Methanocaldococcus villosus KIN24-T80 TaxID=1069083 RepID=N6VRN3_9EURY|nr:DUF2400 family protein [Methanocaldococcus villosus]ENN95816.1 hypothetical protein J422_05753 [Methanocaldococcus villosus KIN24-T80]
MLIKDYIERYSKEIDLLLNPNGNPPLPFNPYKDEKNFVAMYYLQLASIDQAQIVGTAENVRKLMVNLYNIFGEKLFNIKEESIFLKTLKSIKEKEKIRLGKLWGRIPKILVDVNNYLSDIDYDLLTHTKNFEKPINFVNDLANKIYMMGKSKESAKKKAWMYMRWMVREYPDLKIFHFDPADLYIPVDRHVAKVGYCLSVLDNYNSNWKNVVKMTRFAKSLYKKDPAKIDYPFFLLGREIGKDILLKEKKERRKMLENIILSKLR